MKTRSKARTPADRGAASMLAIIGLFLVALALVMATLSANVANVSHAGSSRENLDARFLVMAGFSHAFSEIRAINDDDGDGGIGSVAQAPFSTASGRPVGEYLAFVLNKAGVTNPDLSDYDPDATPPFYVVKVMAAIPSFADAQLRYSAEAEMIDNQQFALRFNMGAISISGPVTDNPDLQYWDSAGFEIDGTDHSDPLSPTPGLFPAIVFTDATSRDEVLEDLEAQWLSSNLDTKITGAPMEEFVGATNTFDAPITLDPDTPFTSETLNDYRDGLRGYASSLVGATEVGTGSNITGVVDYSSVDASGHMRVADYPSLPGDVLVLHEHPSVKDGAGAGQPRILGNFSGAEFGIPGTSTATVLIDTSEFYQGGDQLTDNHGHSITGAGTLVIMHPIGSKTDNANGKQIDLNWEGDVFVIGYPKDRSTGVGQNSPTDNLLFISRADWNIDGNLILVTAGDTEASLEMEGTSPNNANLNVNGSLLIFAEASGHEAEIDIETHANFEVNGLVGVYGSRVELENENGTNSNWLINGTLAIGLPDPSSRSDDMRLRVRGNAKFQFNLDAVQTATDGLTALQSAISFTSSSAVTPLSFVSLGMIVSPHVPTTTWNTWRLAELPVVNALPAGERGIKVALFNP